MNDTRFKIPELILIPANHLLYQNQEYQAYGIGSIKNISNIRSIRSILYDVSHVVCLKIQYLYLLTNVACLHSDLKHD